MRAKKSRGASSAPFALSEVLSALLAALMIAAGLAAFAAGCAGFLGSEFMRISAQMRGLAAFPGDFPLTLWIHGGKTALGFAALIAAALAALAVLSLSVGSHFHCLLQEERVEALGLKGPHSVG